MRCLFCLFFVLCSSLGYSQENKRSIDGTVVDESGLSIAYTTIEILSTYVGTVCNDEGEFSLTVLEQNMSDTLKVSTIGFKSLKVSIKDYLNQKTKKIILKEDVVSLSKVEILSPESYVNLARKNLKKTTLSDRHQLNILYRRFSAENFKSRFLIEQYIKVIDKGPRSYEFIREEVAESRRSGDYRFVKKKQTIHAINIMTDLNPLRQDDFTSGYKWKKSGSTSYDGEDVLILEGERTGKQKNTLKLYVGLDTYSIYKIEMSRVNAVYLYKKNKEGKMYLSYHNREWTSYAAISKDQRKLLNTKKNKIKISYRHEAIVLEVITDKDKIDVKSSFLNKDIADMKIPYHPTFWEEISLPPESSFYKKSVKELESIYGVPLADQFKLEN